MTKPHPSKNDQLANTIVNTLERIKANAELLAQLQWDKGRRPSSANDAGTRQRGGKSDPTGDTACDMSRLKLRDALKATERDLDHLARVTLRLDAMIVLALKHWDGEG